MKTLVVVVGVAVAWLTRKERNPMRWPVLVRNEADDALRDAREALVDGARAGKRAERAFDEELSAVRADARRW